MIVCLRALHVFPAALELADEQNVADENDAKGEVSIDARIDDAVGSVVPVGEACSAVDLPFVSVHVIQSEKRSVPSPEQHEHGGHDDSGSFDGKPHRRFQRAVDRDKPLHGHCSDGQRRHLAGHAPEELVDPTAHLDPQIPTGEGYVQQERSETLEDEENVIGYGYACEVCTHRRFPYPLAHHDAEKHGIAENAQNEEDWQSDNTEPAR